ncbi:MAG: FAD-dependent thymidylate synthase [Clostridiales bacterium]|jgi:thymidylate synthase (FAD)|nr:FAD-dependent thymidylate synthase [Clostridiales bacterium]
MAHLENENIKSSAVILGANTFAEEVCAASARISTTRGTALQIFEKSKTAENNRTLIFKVLSSGHKSLIEHYMFNLAFNNVSVFVEQFVIEFRLASFTVQSRRYVDFGDAGFYTPDGLTAAQAELYAENMESLFASYKNLTEAGVPKEDARFVLPYCLRSNFYCACNAREFLHIVCSMVYGRGKYDPELYALGMELKGQFDALLPGVIEKERPKYERRADDRYSENNGALAASAPPRPVPKPAPRKFAAELLSATARPAEILSKTPSFNYAKNGAAVPLAEILKTERPRELELLNYTFAVRDISLAAITHVARHRMQTLLIPHIQNAVAAGRYIMPESVKSNEAALKIYTGAFERNHESLTRLRGIGFPPELCVYFALSGNTLDILIHMNARELAHFFNLRTCRRAQWEIRDIACAMLKLLRREDKELFSDFGPSCLLYRKCPEGRMSCGKFDEVVKQFTV